MPLVDFAHDAYTDQGLQKGLKLNNQDLETAFDENASNHFNSNTSTKHPAAIHQALTTPIQERDAFTLFYQNLGHLPVDSKAYRHLLTNKRPTDRTTITPNVNQEYQHSPPENLEKIHPNTIQHLLNSSKEVENVVPILNHHSNLSDKHWDTALNRQDLVADTTSPGLKNYNNWDAIVNSNKNIPSHILNKIFDKHSMDHFYGSYLLNTDLVNQLNMHPNTSEDIATKTYKEDPLLSFYNKKLPTDLVDHHIPLMLNSSEDYTKIAGGRELYTHPNMSEKSMHAILDASKKNPEIFKLFTTRTDKNPENIDLKTIDKIKELNLGRNAVDYTDNLVNNPVLKDEACS